MLSTLSTIRSTQIGQATSMPLRARVSPVRTGMLEGIRRRNSVLDAMFYDVKQIDADEAVTTSPWAAPEGSILIVPPTGAGSLALCPSIDDFVARGGAEVRSIAVAGVGSSALGSAAFAHNVANATGYTVAAVVSGYGLADVATEALGGFFLFGSLNSVRHAFEGLDCVDATRAFPFFLASEGTKFELPRRSRDTQSVVDLLARKDLRFDRLFGHSKGNLVISEALFELRRKDPDRAKALASAAQVVTVSARIAMPPIFENVVDIMGEWDWFGGINSRPDIAPDHVVPRAWHHTNTELAYHLPVEATLRAIL